MLKSLDVGCGVHKRGVIGVDVIRGSCQIIADAHNLPFRNKIFKNAFCFEVLEHLENPYKALREIARVINGNLILTIPNLRYWTRIVRWIIYKKVVSSKHHINAWDLPELTHLLNKAGFKVVKTSFVTLHYHKKKNLRCFIDKFLPSAFSDHSLRVRGAIKPLEIKDVNPPEIEMKHRGLYGDC